MDFVDYLFERKAPRVFTKGDVMRAAKDIGIDLSRYDYKNVMLGMRIESKHGSKHGNDVNVTGDQPQPTLKLVIANLRENPKFYTERSSHMKKNIIRESVDNMTSFDTYVGYLHAQQDKLQVGAGILPICKTTGRILMVKRADNVNNPGVWAGFGGKLEQDMGESEENVMEVAKRELSEESGFKGFYSIIPSFIYMTPNGTFKFYNFIGLFDQEFAPALNEEHTEFRWFTLNEASELPNDKIHFGIKLLFSNDPDIIKKYAK